MTRKGFLGRLAGAVFGAAGMAEAQPAAAPTPPAPTPTPDQQARREMIEELAANPLPDELARKQRSEAALRARGVRVLDSLPVIAGESRSLRRTGREVAERALGAMIAAVKGETNDYQTGQALLGQYDAAGYLTAMERAFLADPDPDPDFRRDITWRYEGVFVLLWAVGLYDEMLPEDEIVDVAAMGSILRDLGAEGLFAAARLRPQAEILDMADYMYRLNWAVTDARLKGDDLPEGTDISIMHERCRALNWLYGYAGQGWDEVSADT